MVMTLLETSSLNLGTVLTAGQRGCPLREPLALSRPPIHTAALQVKLRYVP